MDWVAPGRVFIRLHRFSPVTIIPPVLHTLLHLNTAITRRTSGRRLGTRYPKDDCFINNELSDSGALLCQKYSFAYRRALTEVFFFFHTSKEYSFFLFFLHKISWMFIRFEFYTTVKILFTVFWVLTPCGPCGCLLVFRKSVLCASSGLKCAYVSWWGDCHLCRA